MQSPPVEHLSNTTSHCHPPYPPNSQAAAEEEQARKKKKAEEDLAKEKVQALLAHEDTQYKGAHRKMRCGSCLFHVRSPHHISAHVNILTSACAGFADVNTAIFVGFADLNTVEKIDVRTLTQRKFGFVDLKYSEKWICKP